MTKTTHIFKVIYVGDPRVGKTSLNRNYMGQGFSEEYLSTMGIDITKYYFQDEGVEAVVVFWDVGWQEKYSVVRQSAYMGTVGLILVFDLTRPFSPSEAIDKWLEEFDRYANSDNVPVLILGNKIDLEQERLTSRSEGEESVAIARNYFGTEIPIKYFETSAKTGSGVKEAIDWLIKAIIKLQIKPSQV